MKFPDIADETHQWDNLNHYLTPEWYIFVGSENYLPGWNGRIALV